MTQDWIGWLGDVAKSQAIGAVLWGAGGALLIVGMRRLGRRWWIAGAAVVVAFGVAITYASPIVLDPLFNKFTPLKEGRLRSEVLDLARRAGVDVGQVYEIDASRRTTAANAYVTGIGHTKRVVLYDNLLKDFTPAETRLVVAHELGHVTHDDVPHGPALPGDRRPVRDVRGRPPGRAARRPRGHRHAGRAARRAAGGGDRGARRITVVSNQLSRDVERSADAFALELARDPKTQIAFQRRIAVKNVSDPDPPEWVTFLLGTHPPTIERIGQAEAAARASSREG